jgi:hypothetical protein
MWKEGCVLLAALAADLLVYVVHGWRFSMVVAGWWMAGGVFVIGLSCYYKILSS